MSPELVIGGTEQSGRDDVRPEDVARAAQGGELESRAALPRPAIRPAEFARATQAVRASRRDVGR